MQIQMLQNARTKRNKAEGQRGVALILTLLLLVLLMALTLMMVIATTSDTLINHYYHNFRSSFYASDSALSIARQSMANQLYAAIPPVASLVVDQSPIPAGTETTITTNVLANYQNVATSIDSGQAANSWPENFQLLNTAQYPTCLGVSATCPTAPANICQIGSYITSPAGSQPLNNPNQTYTCAAPPSGSNVTEVTYKYNYPYSVSALGHSTANEQSIVQDTGNIIINVDVVISSSTTTSFAAFGTFIDQYGACSAPFVPGYLTGPFFTNGSWNLGNSGPYTFTDTLGQHNSQFSYWVGNNCTQSSAGSFNNVSVTYDGTPQYQLGQPTIPLPADDWSQQWAVLDGLGCGENNGNICGNPSSPDPLAPTAAQMAADLRNVSTTPYASGDSSGVFLPYTTTTSASCPTAPCMTGGGIYVQGNAAVTMSAARLLAVIASRSSLLLTTTKRPQSLWI